MKKTTSRILLILCVAAVVSILFFLLAEYVLSCIASFKPIAIIRVNSK